MTVPEVPRFILNVVSTCKNYNFRSTSVNYVVLALFALQSKSRDDGFPEVDSFMQRCARGAILGWVRCHAKCMLVPTERVG